MPVQFSNEYQDIPSENFSGAFRIQNPPGGSEVIANVQRMDTKPILQAQQTFNPLQAQLQGSSQQAEAYFVETVPIDSLAYESTNAYIAVGEGVAETINIQVLARRCEELAQQNASLLEDLKLLQKTCIEAVIETCGSYGFNKNNWRLFNDRRVELIIKEAEETITEDEKQELARLEEATRLYFEAQPVFQFIDLNANKD